MSDGGAARTLSSAQRLKPRVDALRKSAAAAAMDGPAAAPSDQTLCRIDRTLRGIAVGTALILAAWVLQDILLLGFAAVLLACILRGASTQLHHRSGLGQGWSLLAVVVALVLAASLLVWWRGPAMAEQASQMLDQLARQAEQLWSQLTQSAWGASIAEQLRGSAGPAGLRITGYVGGVASSVLGIGGSLVVVVATGLFLANAPQLYLNGALHLLPPAWRQRGREVGTAVGSGLQWWFVGQLVDMVVVGVLVGIGLFLLGVPFAPTLGLFAALLNFVPYVGAIAGAVPAVMVALAESSTLALWVAVLFVVVQGLEGNVIAPLIQKRTVSLPPALTIMSQTILGTLFGVLGLVLATPLTVAALIGIRMVYVEQVLERKSGDQP